MAALGAQAAADLEAVHARHEHVDHDRVRGVSVDPLQRIHAVDGEAHLVPAQPQRRAERLPHREIVVHDQHAHLPLKCPING